MKKLLFSAKAEADLCEILEYIAKDNPRAAVKFVASIKEKCQLLANFPNVGTLRGDLAPDLRGLVIANYVVYFRVLDDVVRIERVLHSARDVDALF